MMSESVTVTVQNGDQAGRPPGPGLQPVNLSINTPYFRTLPGMAKIAQMILGIICIALGSGHGAASSWFLFVSITAFILSVLWSFMYLFSVREALKIPINWIVTELLNTGIYAILYFTAFIIILAGFQTGAHIAAGIFGIFNTLAYAAGAYFLYLEQQNGQ